MAVKCMIQGWSVSSRRALVALAAAGAMILARSPVVRADPIGTAFTYQGELSSGGAPATGNVDLRFTLFSVPTGGSSLGQVEKLNTALAAGRFTVELDFGAAASSSVILYVEIETKAAGGPTYTLLSPRQKLAPAPLAITAARALSADNAVSFNGQGASFYASASNLSMGTLASARLSGAYTSQLNLSSPQNILAGNGQGLTGLNASNLLLGTVPDLRLSGVYNAALTFTNPGNQISGMFSGTGTNLTALNATNIASGTLLDARLSPNVPLLGNSQAWNGTQSFLNADFAGVATFHFGPDFTDNPPFTVHSSEMISHLNADFLGGLHSNDFARAVHVHDANAITSGVLSDARLSSNIPRLNAANAFTASNTFSGAVGIGTPTPERSLHVFDGSAGTVTPNTHALIVAENASAAYVQLLTPDAAESGVLFGSPFSGQAGGIIYNNPFTPDGLEFRTNGNVTRAAISSVGNLGIGTPAPEVRLHVLGGIGASLVGGTGYLRLGATTGTNVVFDDNEIIARNNGAAADLILNLGSGGVGIGSGVTTGFKLVVNGSIRCTALTQTSALRYKHDVAPLDTPLERVLQLRPVAFTWNDDMPEGVKGKRDIGLIAEDVARLFPELVAMTDGPGGKQAEGIDYTRVAVLAVQAVKHQQKQLADKQAQIDALNARLERLERLLEKKP